MKRNQWLKSLLVLSLAQAGYSFAGTFHTIIGPDGRPMVVQRPDLPAKNKELNVPSAAVEYAEQKSVLQAEVLQKVPAVQPVYLDPAVEAHVQDVVRELKNKNPSEIVKEEIKRQLPSKNVHTAASKIDSAKGQTDLPVSAVPRSEVSSNQKLRSDKDQEKLTEVPVTVSLAPQAAYAESKAEKTGKQLKAEALKQSDQAGNVKKVSIQVPKMPEIIENKQRTELSTIDGETYVSNEYLENKEFNLEGKKRFYAMPEGVIDPKLGATRIQVVEREKGVGESVLQTLFKRNQTDTPKPVVLSSSYYRVSQQDAAEGLGQQCFADKRLQKAKALKPLKDINLWPRAPITQEFDFEIVKVEESIKNIEIHSYASKQNVPVFYWPFAVFLDDKGCVLEGAGGYKNNDSGSTRLYREKIEGVIQVPEGTAFLMLTPLASAIDVDQRVLSNQGQLKLIAIR